MNACCSTAKINARRRLTLTMLACALPASTSNLLFPLIMNFCVRQHSHPRSRLLAVLNIISGANATRPSTENHPLFFLLGTCFCRWSLFGVCRSASARSVCGGGCCCGAGRVKQVSGRAPGLRKLAQLQLHGLDVAGADQDSVEHHRHVGSRLRRN
jgi:hypothetical protein